MKVLLIKIKSLFIAGRVVICPTAVVSLLLLLEYTGILDVAMNVFATKKGNTKSVKYMFLYI